MLIVFFIFLLTMLYFVYELLGRNLYSPSFLLCAGYTITTMFAIYNEERWGSEISLLMLLILLIGIFSFVVGEVLIKKIFHNNSKGDNNLICYHLNQLQTMTKSYSKVIFVSAISLVMTYFLYKDVLRIAYTNYSEWGNLIYNFKENISDHSMSGISKVGMKWVKAFSFLYLFIFINNITTTEKFRWSTIGKNLIYLLPCAVYVGQSLLTGGRIGIVMLIMAALFITHIIKYFRYGSYESIKIKKVIQGAVGAVIFCLLFFQVKEMIGRQQESEGVLDYIATYLGGSLDLFSQYIRNPMGRQDEMETFSGIISNLQSYMGVFTNVQSSTTHEFRRAASSVIIGNTYTGFRNYYNDFGILGVIIVTLVLATIFCGVYYKLRQFRSLSSFRLFVIVTYSMLLYCIPFHFFTDYFFSWLSVNMVLEVAFVYIAILFVCMKIPKVIIK